jgi:DNA-binding CsgD family transcriptional regulator
VRFTVGTAIEEQIGWLGCEGSMEATIVVTVADFDHLNLMIRAVTMHAELRGLTIQPPSTNVDAHLADRPKPAVLHGLTAVEWQMVALAAQGATRSRIAELLRLAPSTVSTYWARIYAKLHVHTRNEVLDWYQIQVAKT